MTTPGAPAPDRRRGPALKTRLTLAFALSSALPLLVILPVAWTFATRTYEERMQSEMAQATEHAHERLQQLPREIRRDLDDLLQDERIQRDLADPPNLLRNMMIETPFRPALDEIFLIDAQRRYLVNSLQWGNTGQVPKEAWNDYERALDPDQLVWHDVTSEDRTPTLLVLAGREIDGGTVVGARALDRRVLDGLRQRYPSFTYLVGDRPDPPWRVLLGSGETTLRDPEQIGSGYFRRALPLGPGEGRWLILLRSKDDLFSIRRNLFGLFAGLFGLALLISWITGHALSQRITRPVDGLVSALAEVAGGNLDVRLEAGAGPDEFARMAEAFNQMAHDLLDNKQKLLRAERIAAWEEIARRLAHEIKNPLSPIRLAIENCRTAYERGLPEFDEIFGEASQAVLEEVDKLRRIVEEFSQFARLPKPSLTIQDFNDTVRGVLKLHGGTDPQVRADLDESLPPFLFDADQIHRVLVNLVKNALEASPPNQEVRIQTRYVPGGPSKGGRVEVAVMDRGPGIGPEERDQLFMPYFTTKSQGTGLGLAISARIIEEHGGSVDVTSEATGTTFLVTLPVRAGTTTTSPSSG